MLEVTASSVGGMGVEDNDHLAAGVLNLDMSNHLTVCVSSFSWVEAGGLLGDICGLRSFHGLKVVDELEKTNKPLWWGWLRAM